MKDYNSLPDFISIIQAFDILVMTPKKKDWLGRIIQKVTDSSVCHVELGTNRYGWSYGATWPHPKYRPLTKFRKRIIHVIRFNPEIRLYERFGGYDRLLNGYNYLTVMQKSWYDLSLLIGRLLVHKIPFIKKAGKFDTPDQPICSELAQDLYERVMSVKIPKLISAGKNADPKDWLELPLRDERFKRIATYRPK